VAGTLRGEYENAIEQLAALKEEYLATLKNGLNTLKDEYAKGLSKRIATSHEEYIKITDKINGLKKEYAKAVDHANVLRDELAQMFERYSLFNKLQTEGA
jgi:archaellum component FlaC